MKSNDGLYRDGVYGIREGEGEGEREGEGKSTQRQFRKLSENLKGECLDFRF